MYKLSLIVLFAFLWSCLSEPADQLETSLLEVPQGFPQPVFPEDNEFTPEKWALGKRLFFDNILSSDNTVSCASCHLPQLAFSDARPVSEGVEHRAGTRNAPSLANVAYHPYFMREGGVATLEMQILVPIQEHAEFDFNILRIADRMKEDPSYVQESMDAYGREPDAFVITRAISCFERTILSGESDYDAFVNGDLHAMNASAKQGMNLFFSDRLACSQCHQGFNFSNYAFENNGLYDDYTDPGRFRLTELESDRALFKVPSLRNVSITAPYMHDGSIGTLEEVIEHYNSGGRAHPHKSALIKPLQLTAIEKQDLLAFLKSLTDERFLSNPKFYQ